MIIIPTIQATNHQRSKPYPVAQRHRIIGTCNIHTMVIFSIRFTWQRWELIRPFSVVIQLLAVFNALTAPGQFNCGNFYWSFWWIKLAKISFHGRAKAGNSNSPIQMKWVIFQSFCILIYILIHFTWLFIEI